jgi:simple sugar transport system ATP-binding protein
MALIPSDRYRRGLIGSLPVVENLVLDRFRRPPIGRTFWLHRKAILTQGVELLRRFAVRLAHPTQRAASLSGGNAQRVVLARALSAAYSLLVCGQPTRGLDVRATRDVMAQLASVRDSGSGVLLISTDLREVFALSDRCLVIYKGRIIAQFDRSHLDYQTVGAALGGVPPPVDEGAGGVSLGPTNGRT